MNEKKDIFDNLMKLYKDNEYDFDECIDFGTCDKDLLEEIMYLVSEKLLFKQVGPIVEATCSDDVASEKTSKMVNILDYIKSLYEEDGVILLGYLPWKIMDIKYHYIEKDVEYLDKYKDKVRDILNTVNKCREDPDNWEKILNGYFGTYIEDHFEYI